MTFKEATAVSPYRELRLQTVRQLFDKKPCGGDVPRIQSIQRASFLIDQDFSASCAPFCTGWAAEILKSKKKKIRIYLADQRGA